ncbi:hypothetical protein [Hydrogenophaga laconesensis]|uniref:Uncharacterized protein n=1 Tax=Hydrogenophaga laconesensis TaxID=1805971 RepID=A0ABU1VDJ2_9BURK|nr:hypothetical protein [Hydrogenophaga laconesensis]MDR7095534.1 hypothetical protein [Hydrogenophaga laconesensis]
MALEIVQEVSRERAVQAFTETPIIDPAGTSTPESLTAAGVPFELKTATGGGVFVLERQGHVLWITAAAGKATDDLTELGFQLVEETARQCGCTEVGFQTSRRGLVHKSERHGYEVAGWIMRKALR